MNKPLTQKTQDLESAMLLVRHGLETYNRQLCISAIDGYIPQCRFGGAACFADVTVDHLDISDRLRNTLEEHEVYTIRKIKMLGRGGLETLRNIGSCTARAIITAVNDLKVEYDAYRTEQIRGQGL